MTEIDYKARVAKGAARLDEMVPGWFYLIDLGALNIASCRQCVTAQVSGGSWSKGMRLLDLEWGSYIEHGFMINWSDYETNEGEEQAFSLLNDLWNEVISDRQDACASETKEV